jgi:hypothetical protein
MRAKRVLVWVGGSVVALISLGLVGVGGALVWVQTEGGERQVVRWINQALDSSVEAGSIRIGEIDVGWGEVVLHDLQVDGTEHDDIVTIPRLAVDLEMWPLLDRTIQVTELVVTRPDVRVEMGADGIDLPTFAGSDSPPTSDEATYLPAGWTLRVDSAQIRGGQLAVPSQDVALRDLDLQTSLAADHDTVAAESLLAMWRQTTPDLGPVQLATSLRLVNEDLEHIYAELGVRGARVRVSGAVASLLEPAEMDFDLEARVTAGADSRQALAQALGQTLPDAIVDTPPLTVSVDLGGSPGSAAVALSAWWVDVPTLAVADLGAPLVTSEVDAALEAPWSAAFTVDVPQLAALAPLGLPVEAGAVHTTGAVGQTPDGGIAGSAVVEGERLLVSGVSVDRLEVPLEVAAPPDGPTSVEGTLVASAVRPSQAPATIGRLTGSYDLSLGDAVAGEAHLRTASLALGEARDIPLRGEVDVVLEPDLVKFGTWWVDQRDEDRRLALRGRMHTDSGALRVSQVTLHTAPDVLWRNPEPVTLVVADGGIRDVDLALESSEGHLRLVGERIGPEEVNFGADAAVSLAYVSQVAGPFAPDLPAMEGRVTARADVSIGDGIPPALLAVVRGAEVTVTDQLTAADFEVRTRVLDDLAQATATLSFPEEERAMLTAEVALPLEPGLTSVACGGDGAALIELPSTDWTTVRQLVPALPAMPDLVPLPDLVARVWATGDPCDPSTNVVASFDPGLPNGPVEVEVVARDDAATDTLEVGVVVDSLLERWVTAAAALDHADLRTLVQADDPAAQLGAWSVDTRFLGVPTDLVLEASEGEIIGQLTAEGSGLRLDQTQGRLGYADAAIEDVPLQAVADWRTEGDRLVADLQVDVARLAGLAAEGEVGLAALQELQGDAPVSARITRGELPLSMVEPLSGGALIDASGVARLSGTLDGTLAAPDADLELGVRNGALTVAETGVRYSRIDVDAAVEERTLTLDTARMASRPRYGRFAVTEGDDIDLRLEGSVTLDDEMAIRPDVRVRLDQFWAMANDTALLEVSGRLAVEGEVPDLRVSGRVDVVEGRFALDRYLFVPTASVMLDDDIVFEDGPPEILAVEEDADAEPSVVDAVDVDVRVDVRRGIALEATVPLLDDGLVPIGGATDVALDSTVEGRVGVRKSDEEIDVRGRLEAEGTVELFGARFVIDQGTIAFAGSDYTAPNLQFSLERETGSYGTVTATITGTPNDLEVTNLSSDEYEDQSDVMAILLFGRPLSELGAGQSQAGSRVVQDALVNLAGAELESAIGVELVDQVDYTPGSGLSLGWSIGSDGFLTISLNPTAEDDENRTEASLTWLLGRDTQGEVQSGDAAVTSAWLQWQRRF